MKNSFFKDLMFNLKKYLECGHEAKNRGVE